MDQLGKVVNPARGQLNRKMNSSLSDFVPENLISRDGFVPRQPAHLHTQAESVVLTHGIPPEFRGGGVHLFIYDRHTPSIGASRIYRVT